MKNISLFLLTLVISWITIAYSYSQNIENINDSINQIREELNIPGLSYVVVESGKTLALESFGYSDLENKIKETAKSNHFLASATKTVTGIALMNIVESTGIKLEDPIGLYLKDLREDWSKVTIRQAVSHTSGFPSILDENGDPLGGGDMKEAWTIVKKKPLIYEPGSRWQYSQVGLEVIQRICEEVTNQSWQSYVNENVFKKAGMNSTYWLWDLPIKNDHMSVMYDVDEDTDEIYDYNVLNNFDYYLPAGTGMMSNVNDMGNFAKSLQSGKLLSQKLLEEMWTSSEFNTKSYEWMEGYGIGWVLDKYKNNRRVWHSGGAKSIVMHYPDRKLSIIVLTNLGNGGVMPFAKLLSDHFLDN